MQKILTTFGVFCAALVVACSTEHTGDKVIELGSKKSGGNTSVSSSGADAGSANNGSGGGTAGTCGPAFDFATAKQQCTTCHSSAGGNAKWSTADGNEDQWKAMAAQLRASVQADRMPMPKFTADNKAKFISFIDGLTGACTPDGGAGGGGTGGGDATNPPSDPNMMTLAEAKQKCAGCHIPGGSGANSWDKANGTEADWRERAQSLRSAVAGDRMPPAPLVDPEKARMLAYLDKLLGGQANQPITYNLTTAKALCVGCHSTNAAPNRRESPDLDTLTQWRSNKEDIADEVSKGDMPRGKTLSNEERQALLRFIDSL